MPLTSLTLTFVEQGATTDATIAIERCVIAGWTGRDPVALEAHIAELEQLGVKRPASVPIFYRVSASRLTTGGAIEVIGNASSGEVEFLLLQSGGRLWVGLGSDHTDREAETIGVTLSKQLCDKPIAAQFWPYDEVAAHWDDLRLRSFVFIDGVKSPYQDGPVTAMRAPAELIELYAGGPTLAEGTVMFCGTLAAHGGVRPAEAFEMELDDPRLGRSIRTGYTIAELPVLG
jgi:hypothetical protein